MPVVELQSGKRYSAPVDQSILDAARNNSIILEYSCRTGRCGVCKAKVLTGTTRVLRPEDESLSQEDAAKGMILTCCRAAETDIVLDVEQLDRLAGLEVRTMPARIVTIDRLSVDIVRVVLKTPPATPLQFVAGQYVDVIAAGVRRSYSLANAPRADGLLELLIKRYPGGQLSQYWFGQARPADLVRIEGPFGTFFLRDNTKRELVFLATGTGIAPVKALLEELAMVPERAMRHRIRVFWGNREQHDFCWEPVSLGLDVGFHPLLSGSAADWTGRRGYVQHAALDDGIDPSDTTIYACGSTAMIAAARDGLVAHGLSPGHFFSDAFVSSN